MEDSVTDRDRGQPDTKVGVRGAIARVLAPGTHIAKRDAMRTTCSFVFGLASIALAACGSATDESDGSSESDLGAAGSVEAAVSSSSCSTSAVHGLAQQLVDEINCMSPGALARIDRIPNVSLSSVVFPYLQAPAARGLQAAAASSPISIQSALRTVPQQYLLYRWFQAGRCGISLAAHVGHSNHEQGLAVDVGDHSSSAMSTAGFHALGAADPAHWDYVRGGGVDLAGMSTRAFQRLWNRNHPSDRIAEDGDYGGMTEARLKKSPAGGFAIGAACQEPPPAPDAGDASSGGNGDGVDTIKSIAAASSCSTYSWKGRGQAPMGYTEGVALVFGRSVCAQGRSDVAVAAEANTGNDQRDALSWYNSNFANLGMSNDASGKDTLRHTYTLLLGLGMRESSGVDCTGRDTSASNTSSDSAEAGAWQTSWDSRSSSTELPKLFAKYQGTTAGCFAAVFSSGVSCSAADRKNWGSGDGLEFQRLSKECPGFSAEYAAVMLRANGGSNGHYGPLRTKAAELRPECDAMLHKVQTTLEQDPSLCNSL